MNTQAVNQGWDLSTAEGSDGPKGTQTRWDPVADAPMDFSPPAFPMPRQDAGRQAHAVQRVSHTVFQWCAVGRYGVTAVMLGLQQGVIGATQVHILG